MSETLTSPTAPQAPQAPARPAPGAVTWRLSGRGVLTVTRLELRQRVRSTRWIVVLVAWVLVLGGLAALLHHAVFAAVSSDYSDAQREAHAGAMMFGWVVLLVLALGSLVAPALSATTVNGDRSAGVLATLQATLLTPAEIAVGKLLAAWLTGLALLVTASPFILWAYLSGGTPGTRLAVVLGLLAVMLLIVCAIGLGWSAVAARTASSSVLTYLSVAFLGLGLPVLFVLLAPLTQSTGVQTVRSMEPVSGAQSNDPSPLMHCVEHTETIETLHYERIWWLLAANPFVVIADASPTPSTAQLDNGGTDLLSSVRSGVRELRLGPERVVEGCDGDGANATALRAQRVADRERLGITWPYGLGADLAIGVAFSVVAVRRLRAPARKLPRGTRVA